MTHINDLLGVGRVKAMGYLPLDTLLNYGCCLEQLEQELRDRGLQTLILNSCNVYSGALYAWDRKMLSALIVEHKEQIERHAWPTNPDEFVIWVAYKHAEDPDLFRIVGLAFNDKRFCQGEASC